MFWFISGAPTIICSVYLFFIASPRYVSESIVRVYAFTSGANSGGSISLGGNAAPGAYIYRETIASWGCFDHVRSLEPEKFWSKGDLIESYGGVRSFFLKNPMRLWSYYKSHVYGNVDDESGLVQITVVSFDKVFSYAVNKEVMSYVRDHLNAAGYHSYIVEANVIKAKIAESRRVLEKDVADLAKLQHDSGMADFATTYSETLALMNRFEGVRVDMQSKASADAFFARRSQEFRALEQQIAVIEQNIEKQKSHLKNEVLSVFQEYKLKSAKVAEDLEVILMGDRNLQELERYLFTSSYHVDIVEEPFTPTDATAPRALYSVATIFLISFIIYIVIK